MRNRNDEARLLLPRLCLCAAVLAVAGCSEPAAGKLEIREPRFSLSTTGAETAAVYLTVVNPGSQSDRLVRVETAAAQSATIHESVIENGVVRMVNREEGFEVPAEGKLELAPLGRHIMLTGPRKTEGAPGPILLTLHFEHAGPIEVQAAFSGTEAMAGHEGHAMEHGEHSADHGGHGEHSAEHGDHGEEHGAQAQPPAGGS